MGEAQEDLKIEFQPTIQTSQLPPSVDSNVKTIQASHSAPAGSNSNHGFAESFKSAYESIGPATAPNSAKPKVAEPKVVAPNAVESKSPEPKTLTAPSNSVFPNPNDSVRVGAYEALIAPVPPASNRSNSILVDRSKNLGNDFRDAVPATPEAEPNPGQHYGAQFQSGFSQAWNAGGGSDQSIWWRELVNQPIHAELGPRGVNSQSLVYETLKRSPKIRALSQDPLIRELQIVEADADFDPVSFLRSQFQDRNDPIGDSLSITNDGSPTLQDHIWTADGGIRKKARNGRTYELSQNLGFKNSNSNFFTPQDQGTATLALNVSQPLLRGRGEYINQTQILIAQSATGGAWNTFVGELQDEIQLTVDSYWRLYFDRSVYLQKRRNVERGEAILRTLEGRQGLDSLPSQIARARSAVVSRRTDLANALRDIRNSETELRRLTADRNWQANQSIELIPTEPPIANAPELPLENVVFTALENRPEIKEVIQRSKIAGIQRAISQNELFPELSLLLGTYVSALRGNSNLGQAFTDQFGEVRPGYSVGFEFEMPFRNRAARSRFSQRRLQLAKITAELDEVLQNVIAESQISLRRVSSARQTLLASTQAIGAARADLEQNFRRWESFALIEGDLADGQTPTTVLDQLLDSQERLTSAELVYSQSELELKSAEVALLRTMGTLLMHRKVNLGRQYNGDLPQVQIDSVPAQFDGAMPIHEFQMAPQQFPMESMEQIPMQTKPSQAFQYSENVRPHPPVPSKDKPVAKTSKVKTFLKSILK